MTILRKAPILFAVVDSFSVIEFTLDMSSEKVLPDSTMSRFSTIVLSKDIGKQDAYLFEEYFNKVYCNRENFELREGCVFSDAENAKAFALERISIEIKIQQEKVDNLREKKEHLLHLKSQF
jgi:hypothetical protein